MTVPQKTNWKASLLSGNNNFGGSTPINRWNDWNANHNTIGLIGYGGWGSPSRTTGPTSGGAGAGGSYAFVTNWNFGFPNSVNWNTVTWVGMAVYVTQANSSTLGTGPGTGNPNFGPTGYIGGNGGAGGVWWAAGGNGGGAAGPNGPGQAGAAGGSGIYPGGADGGNIQNSTQSPNWNPSLYYTPWWKGLMGMENWPSPGQVAVSYGPAPGNPTTTYRHPVYGLCAWGGGGAGSGMTSGGVVFPSGDGPAGDALAIFMWCPVAQERRTTVIMA